jgi:hypothetical protein
MLRRVRARASEQAVTDLRRYARPCRSGCGQLVAWAVTAASKRQPLNPVPDPAGNTAAYVDGRGTIRARGLKAGEVPDGWERRYVPHAATCTRPPKPKRTTIHDLLPDRRQLPANVIPLYRERARRRG